MSYTNINKSSLHMNTKLYTGNGTAGHAITGVGFEPSLTWIKKRSGSSDQILTDAVRGAGYHIKSNDTAAQGNDTNDISSFNSDGFTLGVNSRTNGSGATLTSWNWKAGTTSGISAGSQTITPTAYSINVDAGFGIYKYTGNGTAGATISHGLGVKPDQVWVKKLSQSDGWRCYNVGYNSGHQYFELDTTASYSESIAVFNGTIPTSTTVTLGYQGHVNASGQQYIMYVFAPKVGFSKMGRYYGNGSNDGTFVYTGFKPSFVLVKRGDNAGNWYINDTKRDPYNQMSHTLFPNLSDSETSTGWFVDYVSNGFKIRDTGTSVNGSGGNYIYYAVGQTLVGSNNVPCTAR